MARAEPYPSSQTTKSETKTSFRAPPPPPVGKDIGVAAGIAGIIGTIYFISRSRTAAAATPSASASSSGTSASNATASNTSPALGVPGAPSILTQVGATATSAILTTNQVSGATQYNAYEQNTNLLLAESPTNIIDIQGLQTNSGYEVYVRAQNSAGQLSPPSQPLLISTGAGSPTVIINQGGGSTAPAPTSFPVSVSVSAPRPMAGTTETATAVATGLAAYLAGVSGTPPAVQWQWLVKTPSGSVAVNQTVAGGTSGTSALNFVVSSVGGWVVQASVLVGGAAAGTGTAAIAVAANTLGVSTGESSTQIDLTQAGTTTTSSAPPTYPSYATEQSWHSSMATAVGQFTNSIPHVKTPTSAQLSKRVSQLYPSFPQLNSLQQGQAEQAANIGLLVTLNGLKTPSGSAITQLAQALIADNGLQPSSLDAYSRSHISEAANLYLMERLNGLPRTPVVPVTAIGNAAAPLLARYG